ncbi:peptidase S10 [Polymorphobacter arshaanensis]|uniref:Peptidase S10 n=1 Tax=Glacieibacterium arshaanense TaxID=2511025 RepID=A0A4Y9ENF0_9SPHN|nr:peptidase S10 [Polymorphobacter arshaanensis]TFU02959.1 peptidase S10 [Polymorphobacter arshaanensis]
MRHLLLLILLLPMALRAAEPPADAEATPDPASAKAKFDEANADAVAAAWARPPLDEAKSVTRHSVNVNGRKLDYTATAGTLTIRDNHAKPTASVFYVAYTLDGAAPGKRPVTFLFNGGPGSSSIWLHMGSFGPMRVQTSMPATVRPGPPAFGANRDTLLDKTDLVFIDAIGTGYSRPVGEAKGADFWGVDQDIDAFARAITRYVTKTQRWNSPKFLLGESYGTLRASGLAYQLGERGMALNGVVLLSTILNYGVEQSGYDTFFITLLPTYVATAWYHNRMADRPATVDEAVAQARAFAMGPYAAALAKGALITPAERDAVANKMAALTGISADYIKRANLRVDLFRYEKELLRDQRTTVGRLDTRYTGVDVDAAGEFPEYDAAGTAITGAYTAAFGDYISRDLGYRSELAYLTSADGPDGDKDFDWDWEHKAPGAPYPQTTPNVGPDLSAAMRTNPYLKVLALNGYYDLATPFFATEYDVAHLLLEPAQAANVSFRYYPSGHMIYLNPDSLHQLHTDLAAFYDDATSGL